MRSIKDQEFLAKSIKTAINFFEPRLLSVKVTIGGSFGEVRGLHFSIEGLLRMDPAPEPVFFDTILDPSKGEYTVLSK